MARDQIVVSSDFNTRKTNTLDDLEGLAASIKARGLLQPVRLAQREDGRYDLVAGFRRIMAIDSIADQVPELIAAIPASLQIEGEAQTIDNVIENVQRLDINPVDEARGYEALLGNGWTQKGIAQQAGVPVQRVKTRLELLRFPKVVVALYEEGKLPLNVQKSLAKLHKVSPVLAERAAVRCAGAGDHWIGVLAKEPQRIVGMLADDEKEPVWRVGGAWTADRLQTLGEDAQGLFERVEQLEADYEQQVELYLNQEDAEQLVALGDGYTIGTKGDQKPIVVTTAADALVAYLTASLDRQLADFERASAEREKALAEAAKDAGLKPGEKPEEGSDAEAAVKAAAAEAAEKERKRQAAEAERKQRNVARGYNLTLGRLVATTGASMEPSMHAIRLLVTHLLAFMDTGLLAQAGLRLCFEQFQTEKGDKGHITYGLSTKTDARVAATEWVLAGETAQELLGRAVCLFVMAEYADQEARPESQQLDPKIVHAALPDLEAIAASLGVDAHLIAVQAARAKAGNRQGGGFPQRPRYDLVGGHHSDKPDWQGNLHDAYGRTIKSDGTVEETPADTAPLEPEGDASE